MLNMPSRNPGLAGGMSTSSAVHLEHSTKPLKNSAFWANTYIVDNRTLLAKMDITRPNNYFLLGCGDLFDYFLCGRQKVMGLPGHRGNDLIKFNIL